MTRTITARVVLNMTLFVTDPKNWDGTPMSDEEAVSTAMEAMLLNDTLALNPDDLDDYKTCGRLDWNEPYIMETTVLTSAEQT